MPSSMTRVMGYRVPSTTAVTSRAPRRRVRMTVPSGPGWRPRIACGSWAGPTMISVILGGRSVAVDGEDVGRFPVRVQAHGVVLTPHIGRTGERVADRHLLMPVEAERRHVQCGVRPVCVARVERADDQHGVPRFFVALGPAQDVV